jgi:hypothetical protein
VPVPPLVLLHRRSLRSDEGENLMTGPFGQPRQWVVELPFTVPLSMNDSPPMSAGARMARARIVRTWRDTSCTLARRAGVPRLERFTAVLNWQPGRNARRDPENYFAAVKPLVDGLIDAGVARDDTGVYYVSSTPIIHPAVKGEKPQMWLTVVDLSDQPGAQQTLNI